MSFIMANSKLSESDKKEICDALAGLKGAKATAEVKSLADFYRVSTATIYRVSEKVRPKTKTRSDKGKRDFYLLENEALKFAAELVENQGLMPELALEAMKMPENAENFGYQIVDINLGTFRRYLFEHGISRTQKRKNRMTHRRFEADFPGQIFQFDISGLKERWVDVRTRAIHKVSVLEVSKNHSNKRLDRVPLWKFVLVDDKSRKKFIRFVGVQKPNTVHVVNFLREAFEYMGVPHVLYTDNDAIIVNKRMKRGASFINELFKDHGGFKMEQHTPGNPQATGKVERSHKVVEEYEKLVGVSVEYGNKPNLDTLNRFADWVSNRYNNNTCRATGVAPNIAFRATTNPKRIIDAAQFDTAFKARDLHLKVTADVCITVDNVKYQLSRKDSDPFLLLAETGQKIDVYWLDEESYFACITPSGDEYIVEKVEAKADSVGDYKTLPETKAEKTRKTLKESQKQRIKKAKKEKVDEEPTIILPGIDTEIPEPKKLDGVIEFPVKTETGDVERLNELTHQLANREEYSPPLDLFEALEFMQQRELVPARPCPELTDTKNWLRQIFNGNETITENELREAIDVRNTGTNERKLRLA